MRNGDVYSEEEGDKAAPAASRSAFAADHCSVRIVIEKLHGLHPAEM